VVSLDTIVSSTRDFIRPFVDIDVAKHKHVVETMTEVEQTLNARRAELVATLQTADRLVVDDADRRLVVTVQRAMDLDDAQIKALEERIEAESQLGALHAVIEEPAGRAVFRKQLGLTETRNGELISAILSTPRRRVQQARSTEKSLHESYERVKQEASASNGNFTQLRVLLHDIDRLREPYSGLLEYVRSIELTLVDWLRIVKLRDPVVLAVGPRADVVASLTATLGLLGGLVIVGTMNLVAGKRNASSERHPHVHKGKTDNCT